MFCPECGKASGAGRCTSCGAALPLPGEEAVRERPLDRELHLERRDRPAPPVREDVALDRRVAPRDREPAFTAGLKNLTRKLEPRRDPADVLIEQAHDFEQAGETARAFDALAASLLLRPLDARPVRDLERLAAAIGRRRELACKYGEILQARPDHPGAAAIRARIGVLEELARDEAEVDGAREERPAVRSAAAPGPMLVAPAGAFEPQPAPPAVPPPVRREGWKLSAPAAAAIHLDPGIEDAPRRPPPAPVFRDPELLDAALARLPTTPGPVAAAAPRPANREGTVIHGRLAPTWRRIASWLVDATILLAVPVLFLLVSVQGVLSGGPVDVLADVVLHHGAVGGATLALVGITGFVYLTLFGALGGRTVGARLLGLRAVDAASGRPPGLGRAAVRALAAVVGTFAFLSGPMWALFDRRGQALHDKLARTITIVLDAPAV